MSLLSSNIPYLVSALLAAGTTGGTSYAFGIYGQALKETLKLTQSQLDTISSANFAAGVVSWIPGGIVDRQGPKVGLIAGGILGSLALMLFWAISRSVIPVVSVSLIVSLLSACGVLIFVASSLITGSVFKLLVHYTSPQYKGSAVGAAKGYVGLGSGAYAVMFESLNRSNDLDFLPMAAFFFLAAASLPAICFLPNESKNQREGLNDSTTVSRMDTIPDSSTSAHYSSLYIGLLSMAFLVIGQSIVQLLQVGSTEHSHSRGPNYIVTYIIPLVWFGPILAWFLLPTKGSTTRYDTTLQSKGSDTNDNNDQYCENNFRTDHDYNLEHNHETEFLLDESEPTIDENPELHNYDLFQMLQTSPAWLLLWTCTVLAGGGTLMTNNLGQMVQSLGFHPKVVPAALSLFSVFQSFGRVLMGIFSSQPNTRRTVFLIVASVAGLISHTVLAVSTTLLPFLLGVVLSGLAFGMVWPLLVLISGEIFGTKYLGANYMVRDIDFNNILSVFIAQSRQISFHSWSPRPVL
jgi:MFS family permease